ncbi:MAG: hypothetical protein ACODAC_07680 [Pseudomonadota bacterium]
MTVITKLCAVLAAGLLGATAASAGSDDPRTVQWRASRAHDPFNGGVLAVAEVSFDGAKAMVRCASRADRLEIRFFLDEALVAGADTVTWRFDAEEQRSGRWRRSPNGHSLIVPASLHDTFIDDLETYDTIHLSLAGGDGGAQHLMLPLRGSADAIDRALGWCAGTAG